MLNAGWSNYLGNRFGLLAKESSGTFELSFADLLTQALDGSDRTLEMRCDFASAGTKIGKPVHAAYAVNFLQ